MSDHTDTRRFFDAIFERKPADLPVVIWAKGEAKRTTYALNAESAERDASAAEGDVYVGVGLAPAGASRSIGMRGRPSKTQVAGIVGLWADLDVNGGPENKTGAAPDQEAAVVVARSLLEPTMLVHSGYGVQAWWLFYEPWIFGEPEERAGAGELAAKWLKALGEQADFKLDATHDISRVLRVPGTTNHKGGLNAPVTLIELDDDRRYELADFEPHVASIQLALPVPGSVLADDVVIAVNANADPPFDKFSALLEGDEDFAKAWGRTRRDKAAAGWSASEYDLSLADKTVRARWADQEITDLLVAARRKHGDDIKRVDYYARTIARARATVTVAAHEERREAAIEALTAAPATADDTDPTTILEHFETVVGVELAAFVQYGRDPDEGGSYEVTLGGVHAGRKIRVPDFAELKSWPKFENRIATATQHFNDKPMKPEDWRLCVQRLLGIVEVIDEHAQTPAGVLEGWLYTYFGQVRARDRTEALRSGYPHEHDGYQYVKRDHLQHWLKTRGERVSRPDLTARLQAAGFRGGKVSYTGPNGETSTYIFGRPVPHGDAHEAAA